MKIPKYQLKSEESLLVKELNKRKTPIVVIDNSLKKYVEMPLFQDKVDKANDMLKKVGLPKTKPGKKAIAG